MSKRTIGGFVAGLSVVALTVFAVGTALAAAGGPGGPGGGKPLTSQGNNGGGNHRPWSAPLSKQGLNR